MGRNLNGGKGHKRFKNSSSIQDRRLEFRNDGEIYGIVSKVLGNSRFTVLCDDGVNFDECIGVLCGSLRRKKGRGPNRIQVGSLVIASIREFEKGKVDISYKYNQNEIERLVNYGEISSELLRRLQTIGTVGINTDKDNDDIGFNNNDFFEYSDNDKIISSYSDLYNNLDKKIEKDIE